MPFQTKQGTHSSNVVESGRVAPHFDRAHPTSGTESNGGAYLRPAFSKKATASSLYCTVNVVVAATEAAPELLTVAATA